MNEPSGEIVIPRENVNDDTATLIAWIVEDGVQVEAGQAVAQIETSKATMDLIAPCSGILRRTSRVGQEIAIGASIGTVGQQAGTAPTANSGHDASQAKATAQIDTREGALLSPAVRRMVTEHGVSPDGLRGTGRNGTLTKADILAHLDASGDRLAFSTRISPRARTLIAELGLDERDFQGRGMVRSRDIHQARASKVPHPIESSLSQMLTQASAVPAVPTAAAGIPVRAEKLSRAKRTEGAYLRSGFHNTLASVVTVPCRTRGFRAAAGAETTPILIHELARLLKKYPDLNAYYHDGLVHYYEKVNIGFAIDAGKGLKVAVIRDADLKGIGVISDEMRGLVVDYLNETLSVNSLAGGTFTVTDLSGEGVTQFHPLINQGQAAILGIGSEVFDHSPSGEGFFNLILAFDHQLSEGRSAAKFLNELRQRLGHHEASLLAGSGNMKVASAALRCSRCQRGYGESKTYLLQVYASDGTTRPICSMCLEGWT